jgi:RES domain-containing protein
MLAGEALERALRDLKRDTLDRVTYRLIPAQFAGTALSSIGSFKRGGRYNPRVAFEALSALQGINLVKVTDAAILSAKSSPRLLLLVEVTLSAVLDLTTVQVPDALNTNLQEVTGELAGDERRWPDGTDSSAWHCHLRPWERRGAAGTLGGRTRELRTSSSFQTGLRPGRQVRGYDDSGLIDATLH